MTDDLTRDEIWFLKALRAAGERGRLVSLVEVRYVTDYPQSERKSLYVITDHGRQALANGLQ